MWTPQARARMAALSRKTKRYPSDLTDEEWGQIAPLMPPASPRGRKRSVDFREILNALRYLVRSGGGWEMLPVHFGPWQTVYRWFRRPMRRLLFHTSHDVCKMLDREAEGREASPTGGVIDSRSIKAPHARTRGYDAGKKIVIYLRQVKTRTEMAIPIHRDLANEIEQWHGEGQTFLTGARGAALSVNGFYNVFKDWCRKAGLPERCSPHGLRKAAARRLAEAGCSTHEIAAITGHRSLIEIGRYTRAVAQAKMAESALAKL